MFLRHFEHFLKFLWGQPSEEKWKWRVPKKRFFEVKRNSTDFELIFEVNIFSDICEKNSTIKRSLPLLISYSWNIHVNLSSRVPLWRVDRLVMNSFWLKTVNIAYCVRRQIKDFMWKFCSLGKSRVWRSSIYFSSVTWKNIQNTRNALNILEFLSTCRKIVF